eukprot:TRINITY_DN434_c0_g1_i4.p1 TRINITY_DN434_c0_g1~~TRINITY_DN434_c0_g1_i4.p1  ORF type:complete len:237 (-),score=36.95 TRINITY_DN434_c0_g1_i4:197-907(-)
MIRTMQVKLLPPDLSLLKPVGTSKNVVKNGNISELERSLSYDEMPLSEDGFPVDEDEKLSEPALLPQSLHGDETFLTSWNHEELYQRLIMAAICLDNLSTLSGKQCLKPFFFNKQIPPQDQVTMKYILTRMQIPKLLPVDIPETLANYASSFRRYADRWSAFSLTGAQLLEYYNCEEIVETKDLDIIVAFTHTYNCKRFPQGDRTKVDATSKKDLNLPEDSEEDSDEEELPPLVLD